MDCGEWWRNIWEWHFWFHIENEDLELDTQNEGEQGVALQLLPPQDELKIQNIDRVFDGIGAEDCPEDVGYNPINALDDFLNSIFRCF